MRFHRFWSHGGRAADSNAAGQFQGFDGQEGAVRDANFGQRLGGDELSEDRRSKALAALEQRMPQNSQKAKREVVPFEPSSESDLAKAFVPNFLASNGGWMLACPCGQLHEVSEETKNQLEGIFLEGFSGCLMTSSGADTNVMDPDPAADMADVAVADAGGPVDGGEVAHEPPVVRDSVHEVGIDVRDDPNDVHMEEPDMTKATESTGVSDASPSSVPMELPLELAELEAQGLDGAAVWMQRFESCIRGIDVTWRAPAVETLLKLVTNVVKNPGEPKFRRIRAENAAVKSKLLSAGANAESLLTLLGFEITTEGLERVFVLSDHGFDVVRLRMGQELLEVELTKLK